MPYRFKNLVFEGGGVKGIAYLGALEELANRGICEKIERVGGASAGAIIAVLVALGYSVTEIKKLLWGLDFKKIMDDSWGFIRDVDRLIESYGWYKGDYFRNWIGDVVGRKTGSSESTFADIEVLKQKSKGFKSMYFIGTNLSTNFSEIFSAEHTPRMCMADAVRISMSIPLFFAAKRSPRGDVYVDGGILDNYPVKLFDREKYLSDAARGRETDYYNRVNAALAKRVRPISKYVYNKETLGFRLDTKEEMSVYRDQAEPVHNRIDDFFDYALNLVKTVMGMQENIHLHSDDWQRTIYIDTLGISTTQFDISDLMKKALVKSGRAGVNTYFKWFDSATTAAINK